MPQPLIFVTGAGGKLGSVVCDGLQTAKRDVRATDRGRPARPAVHFVRGNLLDPLFCRRLVQGVDTVVHLANHSNPLADSKLCFDENVAMNRLIFQSACEAGVRKIIFASSLSVLAAQSLPSCLPFDEQIPALPDTPYGRGKLESEQLLASLCRQYGTAGVVLRLPVLTYGRDYLPSHQAWLGKHLEFAFGYLTYRDAAELIVKIIDTELPGFRIYLPASRHNALQRPVPEVIRDYFPEVPLRKTAVELDGFIDFSTITRETGWEPRDQSLPQPARRRQSDIGNSAGDLLKSAARILGLQRRKPTRD